MKTGLLIVAIVVSALCIGYLWAILIKADRVADFFLSALCCCKLVTILIIKWFVSMSFTLSLLFFLILILMLIFVDSIIDLKFLRSSFFYNDDPKHIFHVIVTNVLFVSMILIMPTG